MQEQEKKQQNKLCMGSTTFYVTSSFLGTAELSYLIKRLIKKELEQESC